MITIADTQIESAAYASLSSIAARGGTYYTSPLIGYIIEVDSAQDLVYKKTIDGGATWSAKNALVTGTVEHYDCWADWQTAGDAGTKIHFGCIDAGSNTVIYGYLDTADDSEYTDTIETCQGTGTMYTAVIGRTRQELTITKARGGNIAVAFRYQDSDATNFYMFYTSPDGDNWTPRTSPWEAAADHFLLFQGNYADNQDLDGTFWDISADEITLKTFDNSDGAGGSWSEQSISTNMVESAGLLQMDGTVRLSDGYLPFVAWSEYDSATADLKAWLMNGAGSIVAKTNVLTDSAESFLVSSFINQNTGRWYVSYARGTAVGDAVKIYYKYSDDSGATWSDETAMQADDEDDERWISSGAVKAAWGGKFQPVWFNIDIYDIFTNTDNGISIAAVGGIQELTANAIAIDSSVQNGSVSGSGIANLSGVAKAVASSVVAAVIVGSGIASLVSSPIQTTSSAVASSISGSGFTALVSSPLVEDTSVVNVSIENIATFTGTHLYWDDTLLADMKTRKADERYVTLKAWCDAHIADSPPPEYSEDLTSNASSGQKDIEVGDTSIFEIGAWYVIQDSASNELVKPASKSGTVVTATTNLAHNYTIANGARLMYTWGHQYEATQVVRKFLENMSLVAYVEDDDSYITAPINWMVSIAGWKRWNYYLYRQWQIPSNMGMAFGCGYEALKKFMTPTDRTTVETKVLEQIGEMYQDYHDLPFIQPYPNSRASLAGGLIIPYLSIDGAPAGWLTDGQTYAEQTFAMLLDDCAFYEGVRYGEYTVDGLSHLCIALRYKGITDYLTTYSDYLDELGPFFAFLTYAGIYPVQIADGNWGATVNNDALRPSYGGLYLFAKEYADGIAQKYADLHCSQEFMQAFLFRDPDLTPVEFSTLGNYYYWPDIGISIWRDWTDAGLLVLNHAGISKGHAKAASGQFQVYDKNKQLVGDASGYSSGDWYTVSWTRNIIVEGDPFTESGIYVPGHGQAKELGEYGKTAWNDHKGKIEETFNNSYYYYVRTNNTPTDNPPYNPYDDDQTSGYEAFWSGDLSLWVRHSAYTHGTGALVLFDRIANSSETRKTLLVHADNNACGQTIAITIDGDIATITKNGGYYPSGVGNTTSKLIMFDPASGDRTTSVRSEDPGGNRAWKYLCVYPTVDVTAQNFLNVLFPDSADYDLVSVDQVEQDNCSGVIITTTSNDDKDLVLFSNDGSPVSEYIELGGYYQARDGEIYTFAGTTVLADFTNYGVMLLELTEGPQELLAQSISVNSSVQTASVAGTGTSNLSGTPTPAVSSAVNALISGSGNAPLTASPISVTSSVVSTSIGILQNLVASPVVIDTSVATASISGYGTAGLVASPVIGDSSVNQAVVSGLGTANLSGVAQYVTSSVVNTAISGSGVVSLTSTAIQVESSIVNTYIQTTEVMWIPRGLKGSNQRELSSVGISFPYSLPFVFSSTVRKLTDFIGRSLK